MDKVIQRRTRHLTLVFEDIDKPHNVSAVLRTAECMGLQDVHFIKNRNDYEVNAAITQGAAKWLSLHHHNTGAGSKNVDLAFEYLRAKGYIIYATSLHQHSIPVHQINTDLPMAIVFGSEAAGISPEVAKRADALIHIPMHGFTESFNLSVSAALIMNTLLEKARPNWYLGEEERNELLASWYRKTVRESDKILARAGIV
jgi:tRNA (guanosine-2'-O-)-methyltransferase